MADELRAPTPEDPVAGRSSDMWMRSYLSRTARLAQLVELNAPAPIITNEIKLVTQALAAIEVLHGTTSLAPEGSC
jgi:hypothetical protein